SGGTGALAHAPCHRHLPAGTPPVPPARLFRPDRPDLEPDGRLTVPGTLRMTRFQFKPDSAKKQKRAEKRVKDRELSSHDDRFPHERPGATRTRGARGRGEGAGASATGTAAGREGKG